jgi:hypothetical protein
VCGVPLHPNKATNRAVVKSDLIKTFVFIGVLVFNFYREIKSVVAC